MWSYYTCSIIYYTLCLELPRVESLNLSSTTIIIREVAVLANSVTEITCQAFGIPAPELHWEKNGVQLNSEQYSSITGLPTVHYSLSTLTVSEVAPSDAGTYTCVATNRGGTNSLSIALEVLGLHQIPKICEE